MVLVVPEFGDDVEAVVDGVAPARALAEDLPVFESCDDVLDACFDPAVRPIVVVVDDSAGVVASRVGDRGDAAVSAVTEDYTTTDQVGQGMASHDDVVAVAGPARADGNHLSPVSADDDLCVDAAPVVLADRGDRLIVAWDEGAVDNPRVFAVVWFGLRRTGQDRHQVMDYPIDGRLAGCKQCGQRPGSSGWCASGSAPAALWLPAAGSKAAPQWSAAVVEPRRARRGTDWSSGR